MSEDGSVFHGFTSREAEQDARTARRERRTLTSSLDWDPMLPAVSDSLVAMPRSVSEQSGGQQEQPGQAGGRQGQGIASTPAGGEMGEGRSSSDHTVVDTTGAHHHLEDTIRTAEVQFEFGIYNQWSGEGWSDSDLQAQVAEITAMLAGLSKAFVHFERGHADMAQKARAQMRLYSELLKEVRAEKSKRGYSSGGRNTPASLNPSGESGASQALRLERAHWREKTVFGRVERVLDEYDAVAAYHGDTTQEVRTMERLVAQAEARRKEIQQELEGLADDGIAGVNRDLVFKVDRAIEDMQVKAERISQRIISCKRDLGYLPHDNLAPTKRVEVKPPVFTGKADDDMDYFTFKQMFDEYCTASGIINPEDKMLKLRFECLAGEAKVATTHMTNVNQILGHLEATYGRPGILFSNRAKEIYALGRCPADFIRRRTWVIMVRAKLQSLEVLATRHKLMFMFDSSHVLGDIQNNLAREDAYRFRDLRFNKHGPAELPGQVYVKLMLEFLAELETRANSDLDCQRVGMRAAEAHAGEKQAKVSQPVKKAYMACFDPTEMDCKHEEVNNNEVVNGGGIQCSMSARTKEAKVMECSVCEGKHTHLCYCKKFQAARVRDRWPMIVKTGSCVRCLRLDAAFPASPHNRQDWFREHKPFCDDTWVCQLGKCKEVEEYKQNHITACRFHIKENQGKQGDLVKSLDQRFIRSDARFFFANSPCFQSDRTVLASRPAVPEHRDGHVILPDVSGTPIYMLQYVASRKEPGTKLLTFYDTGCYAAAISARAYQHLDCENVRPGPTHLEVAGNKVVDVPYGDERFHLELNSKTKCLATITALRMEEVSSPMPVWPIAEAWKALQTAYTGTEALPTVEQEIGGSAVDIMVGIRYHCYYPTLLFWLPGGLGIYKSRIKAAGGHNGVLGGPHPAWEEATKATKLMTPRAYFTNELRAYQVEAATLRHVFPGGPEAGCSDTDNKLVEVDCEECASIFAHVSTEVKRAQALDEIGASVEYRCIKCRSCHDCTKGEMLERVSLVEEREQALIEACVELDPGTNTIYAKLPFIANPDIALTPNRKIAHAILESQMRVMQRDPAMRADVLKSHNKLVEHGHVVELSALPEDVQREANNGGYYIPWRSVYNPGSLSTPCRMVFDASSRTPGGSSLNEVLAKGQNKLAKLFNLVLKFRMGKAALAADVSMAYNAVKLVSSEYKYQKYLWVPELEDGVDPVTMVVRTMIYGVKSSGNLTMAGFQLVADYVREHKPELVAGADALADEAYMDDIAASFATVPARDEAAEALERTLAVGGMSAKAVTKSGEVPCEKVSGDGVNVGIVGYLWRPLVDELGVEVKPLFFGKAKRGKLPSVVEGDMSAALQCNFTKRNLAGKVAGLFDPLGLFTPMTARLKLDMADINKLGVGWDEPIPLEHLDTWLENLRDIQGMKELAVPRSVFHPDSVREQYDVIVCCDASQAIAVAAVYIRSELAEGRYSCRLLTAKSKLVNKSSIPRAELAAARIGASLSHVVRGLLGDRLGRIVHVTDSAVALHWVYQDQRPLQVGVRNAVIEIRRLSEVSSWRHIDSDRNPADIATRRTKLAELKAGDWFCGKPWMLLPWEALPVRTLDELELSSAERSAAEQEIRARAEPGIVLSHRVAATRVQERYKFSGYLIDPCKWPWGKFQRVLASVVRCADIWRGKAPPFARVDGRVQLNLAEGDYRKAEDYLFRLTTVEVKHFAEDGKLRQMGKEVDGILRYTGRVLEDQHINDVGNLFMDLSPLSFVKPILDRFSPVAYAIMLHSHEKLTHHGSAVAGLRESRAIAFILHGRSLAIEVREACIWCRRYKAKMVEVELGKFHQTRLTIAPAFYNCQVDLFGPLSARCEHNHRSTVKVWGVVFKCPATLAVAVFTMQAYNTAAFTQAYTRFSSRYGHPAKLYIDAGSQLVKGCKELQYSVVDLTKGVVGQFAVGVDFETCPVGAHNAHGMVERSIRVVRDVFRAVFQGLRLDVLAYETAFSWIANELNSLPICLGSKSEHLGSTDLITPSRLLLGRNNRRAPAGYAKVQGPGHLLKQMEEVEKAWWGIWREEKLADLVPRPLGLWDRSSRPVSVGDIVVFLDMESVLGRPPWRTGRVAEAELGTDGAVRIAVIEYFNPSEKVARRTRRSVRKIAVLHHEGDLELVQELNRAAHAADQHLNLLRHL